MRILITFIIFTTQLFAAQNLKEHLDKVELDGLNRILKTKYLRVLTTRNPYDYYMYQGKRKGLQYEMVKEFTKHLNKKYIKKGELRIVFEMIPVDFDQLIPMLNAGKGDFIAVGLTKTKGRQKSIVFTQPYQKVSDVIITRKELVKHNWKEGTFHIQKDSSYRTQLKNKNISRTNGISHQGD